MAKRKVGASHVGGTQLPMFVPDVTWRPPTELPDLRGRPLIGLDTETRDIGLKRGKRELGAKGPGWATREGYVAGVSAAWANDSGGYDATYIPLRHPDTECFDKDNVARWLRDISSAGSRFVFHSAGYDLGWLRTDLGVNLNGSAIDDTVAMAVAVDENRISYRLDDLCKWKGVAGKDESILRDAAAAYDLDPKSEMWCMPARFVAAYGMQDPVATLGLREALWPTILDEGTEAAYQLEMDIVPLVLEMRLRGVRVDLDAAERSMNALRVKRDAALEELGRKLGTTGVSMENLRSPAWLEHQFGEEGVPFPVILHGKNKGRGTFTSDWMKDHEHWLPSLVSRTSKIDRCAELFLKDFIIGCAHNGRLHATVNQYRGEDGNGTRTTRVSYSDPPLQQMPSNEEEFAEATRNAFIPEDGEKWLGADYSQQELRFMVHFACAPKVNLSRAAEAAQRYADDPATDFHKLVIEWTGLARKPAKNATFAKAFGAGLPKFAVMIGKGPEEAKRDMARYDSEMPFVQELSDTAKAVANERGYIILVDGSRAHFDEWEPTWREKGEEWFPPCSHEEAVKTWGPKRALRRADIRKAMSKLIQGSAARQTKRAMRECWRAGYVPLLQMHDELDFSVSRQKDGTRIAQLMREAVPLRVPSKVDADYGVNWGEATHDIPADEAWRKEWDHVPARVG